MNELKILFKSLAIQTIVAILPSLAVYLGSKSIICSVLTFISVIVLQVAYFNIKNAAAQKTNKELEFLAEQALTDLNNRKMPYVLNCAYCNTSNKTGISFTMENHFTCAQCNQLNKVLIQFTTVRVTTMLSKNESTETIDMDQEPENRQTTINEKVSIT